jgi:hypothetical protein
LNLIRGRQKKKKKKKKKKWGILKTYLNGITLSRRIHISHIVSDISDGQEVNPYRLSL